MTFDPPHILIIDPATNHGEVDCFNNINRFPGFEYSYHLPALFGFKSLGNQLNRQNPIRGIIVFGSGVSVNDNNSWQIKLEEFLTQFMDQNIPVLGICYGHQFLWSIFGGECSFVLPSKEKLQGLRELNFHGDSIFGNKTKGSIIVSHRECTRGTIKGVNNISSQNSLGFVEVFKVSNKKIYGVQGHPEATLGFMENNSFSITYKEKDLTFGWQLVKAFLNTISS